ncbi:MAG: carboxypeptidase-like regulatory domain-containing protein [Prevotella sp.]|nr:carboxypeptidase-like regulatory domain-containing protein [Prevotella sp.]MBR3479319.1 carboxypeptidase-like regulatory domain-containing protein [Prevotella sp.]MBR3480620.1 carboxypeptidase-like regulatory domain-containing protein [Prevotella sp.]
MLKGLVTDDEGNALELATVSVASQGKMTMTNLKGEYSMTLQSADSVVVRFSMIGYRPRTRTLYKPQGTQTLRILLRASTELGDVVITEKKRQTDQMEQLDIKEIKETPSVTGNAVEELVQQQAGVSTHNELSSQYNVRGGSFDENSVYINNVEVYRPLLIRSGQQEGLSVINSDMVDRVSFSSGGFPAKYGDKMSSALDITYRTPKKFEATAMASLLGGSAFVGMSTWGKNKSQNSNLKSPIFSMSHGLRYKTNRYLLGSLQTTGEYRPNQLDYQTYITFNPNRRWTINLLGNISENHYNFKPKDRETSFGTMEDVKSFRVYFDGQERDIFRTLFGTASITRHITDSMHVKLLWSAFHTKEQERYDIQGQYWLDDTQSSEQLGVGTYAEHARNYLTANVQSLKLLFNRQLRHHDIEGALTVKWEHIKEQSREYEMRDSSGYSVPHTGDRLDLIYTLSSRQDMKSTRIEGYLQDTYKWTSGGKKVSEGTEDTEVTETFYSLNYGVRFANWSYNKETIVSPRVSLAIVPGRNPNLTYRFATGLYYQAPFYKELRDTITQAGVTVVKLNNNIKSQRSLQFIAAVDYRFKMMNRPFKFTAEAYYKALSNLIPYNVQNVKITYYGENLCSGYAAGLDLKLFGEFVPGTDSWITFSLMRTQQKKDGVWLPMPTDQRFGLNLHFTDYFPGTDRWKMTLRLAYADGLPFGAPHRGIDEQNFRAPAYKRADIGMSFLAYRNPSTMPTVSVKRVWLGLDCLNLFGISNVNSYYWVTDVSNRQWAVPNYLTGRQINGKVIVEL